VKQQRMERDESGETPDQPVASEVISAPAADVN